MGWIYCGMLLLAVLSAAVNGKLPELSAAALEGARSAVELGICVAGPMLLWCGVGTAMQRAGLSDRIARQLRPVLERLFPEACRDPETAGCLSANLTANLLGLGNAATPMGIRAAQRMARGETATDELCRLVVLNTASVQLIPTTVASLRAGLGAKAPFDILPAVWLSSLCALTAGLSAAFLFSKRWRG